MRFGEIKSGTRDIATPAGMPLSMLNLSQVRNAALLIVTVAVALQLAIFFSIDNLIASALLLCGAFLGFYYAVNRQLLHQYPLSTVGIIGYVIYQFVIPPLGKLADFQSILTNLHHPVLVWTYGLTGLLTLVVAHYVYRTFSPFSTIRWTISGSFYRPLHFFDMPDELQFWLMGAIGVASTLALYWLWRGGGSPVLRSAARPLNVLIYVPYFYAYPNLLDPRYRRRPVGIGLIAYTILVLAVSAIVNSRFFAFIAFASIALLYGYRVAVGTITPPKLTLRSLMAAAIGLWLISGPATNLAASMVMARGVHGGVSEVAKATWHIYRRGIAVKAYEAFNNRAQRGGGYNEIYYNNIFLNRIGNVRFIDLSIDAAQGAIRSGGVTYFREIQFDKVIALIPAPILRTLRVDINKEKAISGSSEDFLYALARGAPVGGFKTGSSLVILYMTFGIMWPVYFGLLSIMSFTVFDGFTGVGSICARNNRRFECVVFSPVTAATFLGFVFYPAIAQDLSSYLSVCTRDAIVMGLFYAAVFVLTKFVSSSILGWNWREEDAS